MEPLSSIAAAIGLADAGLRTLVSIYGMAIDLKEVPKRLREVHHDVQSLRGFVADMQIEVSRANGMLARASPTQLRRLDDALKDTTLCVVELARILASVVSTASSSRAQRAWRAAASLSKQKEIMKECDRLERLKNALQLELQSVGIAMVYSTNDSIGEISRSVEQSQTQVAALHAKVDDLRGLLLAFQSSLDETDRATQTKTGLLERSFNNIVQNQELHHRLLATDTVESLLRLEEAVAAATAHMQQTNEKIDPVAVALARVQESSARVEGLAHSLHQHLVSDDSHASILTAASESERRQAAVICCRQLTRYPADLRSAIDRVSQVVPVPHTPGSRTLKRPRPTTQGCSCETKKMTSSRHFGPLETRYASTTFHERSCPWFWDKGSHSDYIIRISMKPFVSRTIELLLSTSRWAGGSTVSRTLKTYRTVSRLLSPAFQLFEELNAIDTEDGSYGTFIKRVRGYKEDMASRGRSTVIGTSTRTTEVKYSRTFTEVLQTGFVSDWLESVPSRLDALFTSGAAQPTDTDEFGNTLLHEIVFSWSLLWDRADLFGDQIRHIAGHLYDLGADAGAVCPVHRGAARKNKCFIVFFLTKVSSWAPYRNPSVTDLAFHELLRPGPTGKATTVKDRCPFPFRILSEHGIHVKDYHASEYYHDGDSAAGVRSRLLEHTVRSWGDFESDAGFTPLHETVIARNLAKMISLMRRFPAEDETAWNCELTIVECALGWREGLTTLCNAGYRVNHAFEVAIFRGDSFSTTAMMGSDINIDDDFLNSIAHLHSDKDGTPEIHRAIITWAANCLHIRRLELQDLALAKLPVTITEALGLNTTQPPDSISGKLIKELKDIGIATPRLLLPTSKPIFHSFSKTAGAAIHLAQALYEAKFCEVDALDLYGRTPLEDAFIALFNGRYDQWPESFLPAILWMIRHGSPVDRSLGSDTVRPLFGLACLYSTNYNCRYRWTTWHWENDETLERLFTRLRRAVDDNEPIDPDKFLDLLTDSDSESSSDSSFASRIDAGIYHIRDEEMFPDAVERSADSSSYISADSSIISSASRESGRFIVIEPSEHECSDYQSDDSIRYHRLLQRAPHKLISEVAQHDPELEDNCYCYCSLNGCVPTHMIPVLGCHASIKSWAQIQEDIFSWIYDCGASDHQRHRYIAAACRLEVFSRLGMAHTCCRRDAQFHCANLSDDTRLELQEEDADFKTQLELIMEAFDTAVKRYTRWSLRYIWARWWRKLDTILPPLLPWERGLRYCTLQPEMPSHDRSSLLQLREFRHAIVLKDLGYARDVHFLDVIKDYLPGLLDLAAPLRVSPNVCIGPARSREWPTHTRPSRDNRLTRRRARRKRSF